jgi:hypothetical protein
MTDSLATWNLLALLFSGVFGVIGYVWIALGLGAVFAKVGVERWKAWVPFYNFVVLLGLGGLSGWLLLLLLIPVFGPIFVYVAIITAAHRVGGTFGYGPGMTVLAALLFPVWASVLGFGAARPVHPVAVRAARPADGGDDLRAFSAPFDRAPGGDDLAARRSVPTPSAWIPPAPPAPANPDAAAPATAPVAVAPAPAWGEPSPAPAAAPVPAYEAPAYEAPAADPYAAPAADPYVAPAAETPAPPVQPAASAPPVMSWWQPAIVDEAEDADASDDAVGAADLPDWARPVSSAPAAPAPVEAPVPPAVAERVAPPEAAAPVAPPEAAAVTPEPAVAFAPPLPQPVLRESYLPESDAFPEASGEVSAVVGAPVAGLPRSASASVAAARPGVGDFVEDTVIASRRRPKWALMLPDGSPLDLSGDTAVLGRRPVPVHSAPGAQLVVVADDTRTVSKTHAVLRRRADVWMIADLGSTNGVIVLEGDAEIEVAPGTEHEIDETFLLGDAVIRIVRTDA